MTTTLAPSHQPSRGKAGALAGLMVVLLAGGAGWWAYSQSVPRPANAADFRPDPGGRRGWLGAGNARPRDPVTVLPRVVTIRDGEVTLSTSMRSDKTWTIAVTYNGNSLGGPEAERLLVAVRRVLDMTTPPARLKLTPDQKTQLAAVQLTPLELDVAQLKGLTDLLNQSQKTGISATDLASVKQSLLGIAARAKAVDKAAVKAKYDARDAKFRSILSAEQVDTLLGVRGNRNNTNRTPAAPPRAPA